MQKGEDGVNFDFRQLIETYVYPEGKLTVNVCKCVCVGAGKRGCGRGVKGTTREGGGSGDETPFSHFARVSLALY